MKNPIIGGEPRVILSNEQNVGTPLVTETTVQEVKNEAPKKTEATDQVGGNSTWQDYAGPGDGSTPAAQKVKSLGLTARRAIKHNGHSGMKAALYALAVGSSLIGGMAATSGTAYAQDIGATATRTAGATAVGQAIHVSSAADMVRNWSPAHHIYVVGSGLHAGNATVSNEELNRLDKWMSEHAPNATGVVLQ
jgi:hypothetical protein